MTLRVRLGIAVAVLLLVLLVIAVLLPRSVHDSLVRQVDTQLVAAARSIPPRAPASGSIRPPFGNPPGRPVTRFSELYVARITGDKRAVFVAPAAVAGRTPAIPEHASAAGSTLRPTTVGSAKGTGSWRVVMIKGDDGTNTLIALPLDRVESTDHRLRVAIGIGAVLVLTTLAAATWWLLRLGLRPIAEVTEVADAIARGDRSRRMREGGGETEAAHLAHAFNVMLDEQQAQEDQLRQFVADASHELRTPVAAIGGFVDLWRQGAIGDDEVGEVMRRIGQESVRMRDLVEDLLLLARLDEGRPLAADPVDLTALANDAALDASATHPSRPVAVQSPGPIIITGDEPRLRQLLGNLVNNALVHTDMNTHVTVRVEPVGDRVILSVLDDGPGMTRDEANHAFDRFWRADEARQRTGTGLGLAIVRQLAEAHGGHATLDTTPGVGTTVRIDLPAVAPIGRSTATPGRTQPVLHGR
jgi:two-component system, OmpR family, sensor kinase